MEDRQDLTETLWQLHLNLKLFQTKSFFKGGNYLVVLWLGLCTFTARGTGLIPGWETKIPQAAWYGQKNKIKS